MVMTSDLQLVL